MRQPIIRAKRVYTYEYCQPKAPAFIFRLRTDPRVFSGTNSTVSETIWHRRSRSGRRGCEIELCGRKFDEVEAVFVADFYEVYELMKADGFADE